MNLSGITFEEDCLIGANSFLDRWFCSHPLPFISTLARSGILLPIVLIIVVFVVIAVAGLLILKKRT